MSLRLSKEGTKEIPFQKGRLISIQTGSILDSEGTKKFRYTRSVEMIRARYRITLQYSNDEKYTPYVFDAIRSEENGPLDVRPDSDPARQVWLLQADPRRAELLEALETIFGQDIELNSNH